jgi:hypothetical protein
MNRFSSSQTWLSLCLALGFVVTNLHISFADNDDQADKPDKAKSSAVELSVAPSDYREYPKDRPSWIDAPPSLTGIPHRWSVASAPCRTEQLAEESLAVNLRAAVETYVENITGEADAEMFVKLDDAWIQQHRDKSKQYQGTIKEGDETLFEVATVLVFGPEDQDYIRHLWHQHQVSQRLAALGILSTGVVAALVSSAAGLSIVTRRAERRVTG